MFEAFLSIFKVVFGDGFSGLGNLQKLKGDRKKALFWALLHLYESLERLERNVTEILDEYVEYFILWAKTGEQHTLANYTSSIRGIYFDSYTILRQLLKSWDRRSKGIQSYLRIRDPELHTKLRRLLGRKGALVDFLSGVARVYEERGIELSEGYSSFRQSDDVLRQQAVKSIPYVTEAEYNLDNTKDYWLEMAVSANFTVQMCEVNNLDHLTVYREHLLNLKATYSEIRGALRTIVMAHFTVEEMF